MSYCAISESGTMNTVDELSSFAIEDLLVKNAKRFSSVVGYVDDHWPTPPNELVSTIQRFNPRLRPAYVVDLGCGTGLSLKPWLDTAHILLGVDPNARMLEKAQSRMKHYRGGTAVGFQHAFSNDTGVGAASIDIVTCSQSLLWMEPHSTFEEINRILKPGGVLAVYDWGFPPTANWEISFAWKEFISNIKVAEARLDDQQLVQHWQNENLGQLLEQTGIFRFTSDTTLEHTETADAERHLGLAMSQPRVQNLFLHGVRERDLSLFDFYRSIDAIIGSRPQDLHFQYRIHLGVK